MGGLEPKDGFGEPIEQRIINRAGFKRPDPDDRDADEFIFLPEVWKSEVCAGLDPTAVAKTLEKRGMLKPGSGGKLQNFQRVPGSSNPVRCYVVPAARLLGEESAFEHVGLYDETPAQPAERRAYGTST